MRGYGWVGAVVLMMIIAMAGCGGHGGGPSQQPNPQGVGRIEGTARVPGLQDQGGTLVMAEAVDERGLPATVKALAAQRVKPSEALTVNAFVTQGGSPAQAGTRLATTTDAQGRFKIENVPAGRYVVTAARTGALAAVASDVVVRPGAATQLDIVLTPTGNIAGTAKLNQGTNHTGICVYIPGTSYLAFTDSAGKFTISNVPVGNYRLRAFIGNGQHVDGPQVTVVAGQTVTVSGEITVPVPPANAPPTITTVTKSADTIAPGGTITLGCAASDPDGHALRYAWSVSPPDGQFVGSNTATQVQWKASASAIGQYTATVVATDIYGASDTKSITFTVARASMGEREPNETKETAQSIPVGTTVFGSVMAWWPTNTEHDWFVVQVSQPTYVVLHVQSLGIEWQPPERSEGQAWDYTNSMLEVLDEQGNTGVVLELDRSGNYRVPLLLEGKRYVHVHCWNHFDVGNYHDRQDAGDVDWTRTSYCLTLVPH